jgi:hemolysin-activating ACP:hemolysin acyltransferase
MVTSSDIIEIIRLYRDFPKYNYLSDRDIARAIIPSLSLNQYNIFRDLNNKIYGFVNWSFLNSNIKNSFLKNGVIKNLDWNTGKHLVFVDFIATKKIKDIFNWSIKKASTFKNIDKEFNWIRVENNKVKRINKVRIKLIWEKYLKKQKQ